MLSQASNRRPRVDLALLAIVGALVAIGLISLHSASTDGRAWHVTQAGWLVFGTALAAITATIDYRIFERYAYLLYSIVVLLLIVVLFAGIPGKSMRWLDLGVFVMQPSELMKVSIIFVTARYLRDSSANAPYKLTDLIIPFGLVALPALLVRIEPDLGTSLVIALIFMTVLLFAGVKRSTLVSLGLAVLAGGFALYQWGMEDYQRARVTAFLNPDNVTHAGGWQVRQSIIAIASGGALGHGHRMGTQVQHGFVPENQNDFIFAHIGEEWGFMGGLVLLFLYALLIVWALRIARHSRDQFGVLLAVGIAGFFFWHVTINLGMVLGLLPVVGLWLPFISYGGSSTLTVMVCVGLLMNLSIRRHVFNRL
ncbi:MAG: rod shape-determining protein RodA [Myxococcales bacterium]|nr:rod shape-determining protein RodA [Myxococcales bacterium]